MRIIFAGTPELAVPTLAALAVSSHQVIMALTQPDRPAGRGQKLQASAVKIFAQAHDIPLCQAETLKDRKVIESIHLLQPDVIIVLAYGLLLPQAVLAIPKWGCINVHLSLLPRWRGAAPIQRALLAGDNVTGVTLMQMDSGLDTGAILKHATLAIHADDNTQSLQARLATLGAKTLLDSLAAITAGQLKPQRQDEQRATYAAKITKEEARINWELSAQQIERMIRAFNPQPMAFTTINGKRLRLYKANAVAVSNDAPPGMIIHVDKNGINVACGNGILQIKKLQWAGGKQQSTHAALHANNNPLQVGTFLGKN